MNDISYEKQMKHSAKDEWRSNTGVPSLADDSRTQVPVCCFSLPGVSIDVTMAPRFLSHGQTFRAVIGDTLVLPCEVDDLGKW
jgi:hypothetical protein